MERIPRTRQSAVACPSCGARRILLEALYCDRCGKRIPDSLIKKLQEEKAVKLQGPSATTEAIPSPGPSDRVDQSTPTPSLSDSTDKSHAETTVQGREMSHIEAQAPPAGLWSGERILGMSLAAFGVVTALASALVGTWNLGGLGLASFLIGLLLVFLNSRPSYAPEMVEASVLSSLANLERVLRELAPETRALYLRIRDRLDVPMVFISLEENPASSFELSPANQDRFLVLDSDDPHKTGLLLEAPGASLLALMEKESGVNFIDLTQEDFLDQLKSCMIESLEVAADVKGAVTPGGVKFRIKDDSLRGLSQSVARSAPNVASRLGCPICSAAICAAVKAMKSDMIVEEAAHQLGSHTVSLRFARGAVNETS